MIDNKTIRKVIMLNKLLPSGSPTYEDREASGAIANFTTNTVKPFVKCECTIDATESGTSVLNVEQAGKNLFDKTTATTGAWLNNIGGTNAGTNRAYSDFIPIKLNQPYFFTKVVGLNAFYTAIIYDNSKSLIGTASIQGSRGISGTLTFTSGAYIRINVDESDLDDVQLELGSTATTYEAYSGTTTTVTLEETAYGGSVDVISGSGQIIDEHGDLVYTLFEPVSISAIEGVNNVWCDTGDIEVTYKYKTGEGGSSTKKYLPIFYDMYGKEKYK